MTDRAELVEKVAEELWNADSVRAVGVRRNVAWPESGARGQWLPLASAAIDIALEEAARVVTEHYRELNTEHRLLLLNRAAAIRALIPSGNKT